MSPPFAFYAQAQQTYEPPLVANENAFLGNFVSRFVSAFGNPEKKHGTNEFDLHSEQDNPEKPISCGFFRLEKGTPLVYEYGFDEMKIILEGDFGLSDETGQTAKAGPGDVVYFPKGSKITFTTENGGRAFWVSFPFLSTQPSVSIRGLFPPFISSGADFLGRPDKQDAHEYVRQNKPCAHTYGNAFLSRC